MEVDMDKFKPTHVITFANGDELKVQFVGHLNYVDGVAYTREEWDTYSKADWIVTEDGEWLFKGFPVDGMSVRKVRQ